MRDPPGKRFGTLAEQFGCRAAEHQESRWPLGTVREHPQGSEEIGLMLDFVKDDQTPQWSQAEFGVGKSTRVDLGFQVEGMDGSLAESPDLLRASRLTDLPRPDNQDHGKFPQQPLDVSHVLRSVNHRPLTVP